MMIGRKHFFFQVHLPFLVQLNKYETDQYFLQLFQSTTTVCLIIHVFCKSCEPEIVFVLIFTISEQFHVHKSYKPRESTLSCTGNFEENIDQSHIYLAVTKNIGVINGTLFA